MKKKEIFKIFIYVLLSLFIGYNTYKTITLQDYERVINIIVTGLAAICIYRCNTDKHNHQYLDYYATPVYYEADENLTENYLNFIVNNLSMPAYFIDKTNSSIQGNNKLFKLMGIKPDKITYNDISRIFNNVSIDDLFEENQIVIREKKKFVKEYSFKLSDKTSLWFRVEKIPVIIQADDVQGILVLLNDITAEKELDNQKERFIATLNHDLKTPIIAQIRSLEMLINGTFGEINDNQKEILNLTVNSCNNIYSMVSTIISSYKLENNEIELNYTEMYFDEIVSKCCKLVQKTADEKNIKFIINSSSKKILVNADFHYLKTTILFLLENSISYSFHNTSIEIIISSCNNNLNFEILSKSPYIPDATLQMIFDKYSGQISNYNKIGFCMKLNYCNQVIKAHNGEIIAKSYISNENTLGFRIPAMVVMPQHV